MHFHYVILLTLGIIIAGFESISEDSPPKKLNELLYKAFEDHNINQMLSYIRAGADINTKPSSFPLTMLESAVMLDDTPMVKFLLAHGANAKIIHPNGRNLLSYTRNKDIANLLLKHGASMTQKDHNGNIPMLWGGMHSIELIDFFIEHGVSINTPNNLGQTLLHRVCLQKPDPQNLKIITALIRKGSQVNLRDSGGVSPFLYAAMQDSEERLKLLIDSGAQIDSIDDEGNSALHYAAAVGAQKNISFLIKHGLNVSAKNKKGETYLDIMNRYNLDPKATPPPFSLHQSKQQSVTTKKSP